MTTLFAALRALLFSGFAALGFAPALSATEGDVAGASVTAPPPAAPAADDDKGPGAGPFGQSRLYVGF